ncbi:MAG: hypothetical protein H6850_03730 [Alphaproteobacteria bacterium]|nr:MAG: hypothetical protein H6850_03730 [Alphaproteobacteria bacterium]
MLFFILNASDSIPAAQLRWGKSIVEGLRRNDRTIIEMIERHYPFLTGNKSIITAEEWCLIIEAAEFNPSTQSEEWTKEQKNQLAPTTSKFSEALNSQVKRMRTKRKIKTANDYIKAYEKYTQQKTSQSLVKFIRSHWRSDHLKKHPNAITPFDLAFIKDNKSVFLTELTELKEDIKQPSTLEARHLYIYNLETNLLDLINLYMMFREFITEKNIILTPVEHALLQEMEGNIKTKLELYEKTKETEEQKPSEIVYLQEEVPEKPETLIVFLHGLGRDGRFWNYYMKDLGLNKNKKTLCVALTAPEIFYFGAEHGRQWVDLESVTLDDEQHLEKIRERVRTQARPYILKKVKDLHDTHNKKGTLKKILFVGFSQGGIVGLDAITHTSELKDPTIEKKIQGGTFIAGAYSKSDTDKGDATGKHFLLIHDENDSWVPFKYRQLAKGALEAFGATPSDIQEEDGAPHHKLYTQNEKGETAIDLIREWLKNTFSINPSP